MFTPLFFHGGYEPIFWQNLNSIVWTLLCGLPLKLVHGFGRGHSSIISGLRRVNREIDSGGHGRICYARRPTTEKLIAFDH